MNKTDYENRKQREVDNAEDGEEDVEEGSGAEVEGGHRAEDDDVEEGDDSADEGAGDRRGPSRVRKQDTDDTDEGRTVFVRNLLFETTEAEVFEAFKHFGKVPAVCPGAARRDTLTTRILAADKLRQVRHGQRRAAGGDSAQRFLRKHCFSVCFLFFTGTD